MSCSVALKTITSELPPEGKIATKACEKLTPKLLGQISNVRFSLKLALLLNMMS